MKSDLILKLDCPLFCGYTTTSNSCKSEITCHLKLDCPKRLLLDETIFLCIDPVKTNLEDHKQTCNKCGNLMKNQKEGFNECDLEKNLKGVRCDCKSQYNQSKILNHQLDKSLLEYEKKLSNSKSRIELKKKYVEEVSIENDSDDIKTNYTSGYPSVNDTMIRTRLADHMEKQRLQLNSFYDVPINRQRNMKSNYRQGLNDTMIEEGENAISINTICNRYSKNPQRHLNRNSSMNYNPNDTMIMDDERSSYRIGYGYFYNDYDERIEEEVEEEKENFYFEGELDELDDVKEYFIN